MPTVSTLSQLTFTNLGPLTTTFTAPSTCATAGITDVALKSDPGQIVFDTDCTTNAVKWDCFPEGSAPSPTGTVVSAIEAFQAAYFSPGLYCPSGWGTVGVASRNGSQSVTSSGILSRSAVPTHMEPMFPDQANGLMQILAPSETAVLCCPSSMTGATDLGCYSTLPSYTPTSGCYRLYPESDLTLVSETYWFDGATVVGMVESLVSTAPITSVTSFAVESGELSTLVGVTVVPIVTLIHKEADMSATGSSATSNAAVRSSTMSSWKGLGVVSVVSVVSGLGMILGAAIILG